MGDAEGVACCGCVAALAATRTRATPESAGNSGGAGIDVRGDDERKFSVQKKQKLLIEKAKKKNIFIVVYYMVCLKSVYDDGEDMLWTTGGAKACSL